MSKLKYLCLCVFICHRQEQFLWALIPLHSSITAEEQSLAFKQCVPGYRKIILATNIAESSITVPDIKYGNSVNSQEPSIMLMGFTDSVLWNCMSNLVGQVKWKAIII
jgi:hypothetical protein